MKIVSNVCRVLSIHHLEGGTHVKALFSKVWTKKKPPRAYPRKFKQRWLVTAKLFYQGG